MSNIRRDLGWVLVGFLCCFIATWLILQIASIDVPEGLEPENGPVASSFPPDFSGTNSERVEAAGPPIAPEDRLLLPPEEPLPKSRDERDPGVETEALRREVAALKERLANCTESSYGRLLASGELDLGGATLDERKWIKAWLEQYPITLDTGDGSWMLEELRNGWSDENACIRFGVRVGQELGLEKLEMLCE